MRSLLVGIACGIALAVAFLEAGSPAAAQGQPPTAWYAEVLYEAAEGKPGQAAEYVMAQGYLEIHSSAGAKVLAAEDAARAVREGACLQSVRDLDGGTVYLDPPLCIPAARIVRAWLAPYRQPGQEGAAR